MCEKQVLAPRWPHDPSVAGWRRYMAIKGKGASMYDCPDLGTFLIMATVTFGRRRLVLKKTVVRI